MDIGREWHSQRAWEALSESMGGPDPVLISSPMQPFHLAVPDFYPFITSQQSNKQNVSLSSVSCCGKLRKPKDKVMETSDL